MSHIVKEAHGKEKENARRGKEIVSRSWPFFAVEIYVSQYCFVKLKKTDSLIKVNMVCKYGA